jgi:multiple sugar transport system permease protein
METTREIISYDLPYRALNLKKQRKFPTAKVLSFVFLTIFCVLWMLPFFVLFAGAFRSSYDATYHPAKLFPPEHGFSVENFIWLFNGVPDTVQHHKTQTYEIGYWFLNSCLSAIGGTLIYLIVASLTAYVFVFVDFKFRNAIFAFLVMTLVVPGTATAVGNQATVFALDLNTVPVLGLIIPGLGGVYGMYLIKTFFEGIPKDLVESARMDGCSNFSIFRRIIIPNGKTVLFVQGLFGFMGGWNDLVWPQMLYGIKDGKLWTLQVGMAYIINNSKTANLQGMAFASGVVCLAPVLVVYLIAQNKIIEGMASAGIKR